MRNCLFKYIFLDLLFSNCLGFLHLCSYMRLDYFVLSQNVFNQASLLRLLRCLVAWVLQTSGATSPPHTADLRHLHQLLVSSCPWGHVAPQQGCLHSIEVMPSIENVAEQRGGPGNPLQYSCLEDPHGQRSPAGYCPWGCRESDTTEWLRTAQDHTAEEQLLVECTWCTFTYQDRKL